MSEKKHKGGYELLKEKYTKLKAERDELKQEIDRRQEEKEILVQTAQDNYIRMEKGRDEWKAGQEKTQEDCNQLLQECEGWEAICKATEEERANFARRLAFLLDHCPFWVRWMYRKQFKI